MADNDPIFDLLVNQPNVEINLKSAQEHSLLYYALLKYEAGDTEENNYAARLIAKNMQTNPTYSQTCNNLLQVLILEGAWTSALFLCDHVQNLNHVNANGETASHVACAKRCAKICGKLLELGANPNLLTNELRQTALHYCVLSDAQDCIEEFIEHNGNLETAIAGADSAKMAANFNVKDIDGETPLSLALAEGNNDLVPLLIRGKADVNVRNAKDFTLLHQAILKEDSKTAIFLLDNGADMNAK